MSRRNDEIYFDIRVSLMDVSPEVWRGFLLRADSTFYDLHMAIQDAAPWENSHLFLFQPAARTRDKIAGAPSDDRLGTDRKTPNARAVKLKTYFDCETPGSCVYQYDFGDFWLHAVKLVGCVALPEKFKRRLTGGERAFPKEDSGGVPGYDRCVRVASIRDDPDQPVDPDEREDLEDLFDWIGDWNPQDFDLTQTKKRFDR